MTGTSPSTTPDGLDARVLADQADLLQANVPGNMAGSISAALVAVWMLSDGVSRAALGVWIAAQFILGALALAAAVRSRQRPTTLRNAGRRVRAVADGSLLFGLLWATGVFLLWQPGKFDQQLLLMFLIVGLTSGALHAQMASHRAFLAFFIPCLASVMICAAREPGAQAFVIVLSVLVYGVASARVAVLMHRTMIDSLRKRHEIEALAADLALQKERAEEANLSKSRFLAAASHDLRQPVHALALFAAALGHRPLEPEAARLTHLMQDAVASMSRMFNGLLDVSKLDAGAVQTQPGAFALAPLLERIVAGEGALARMKGIKLKLRPTDAIAYTDPLLLERIVGNLLANAVRYTARGGVLVSAHACADQIVLRVVDTGIGIARESQEAVFAEFVQLHNAERDQTRGFGLGLAIVQRLTALLSLKLTLNSRPGRGTTFTLRLPRAGVTHPPPALPVDASPHALASRPGDLILVIDDDQAARAAMESLLAAWGYTTLSAAGLAELKPQLMHLRAAPVLAISDWRLRGTERGTDVILQLREWFNGELPAIIITGDTAPARLHDAEASGLTLLHKPVSDQTLRAAIGAALTVKVN